MENIVTIGKRLIPLGQIALIEPYDPAQSKINSDRPFKARVVMVDRESVLAEETPESLAATHQFRVIESENLALNPAVRFAVEQFEPAGEFKPTKPYRSRLVWRDQDGNTQSKLLLSEPEELIGFVGGVVLENKIAGPNGSARRPRRQVRRRAPTRGAGTSPA